MAPSTLGTFLRAFTFGHVRQLDRVLDQALAAGVGGGRRPGRGPVGDRHRQLRRRGARLREAGRRLRVHPEARVPPDRSPHARTPARCCTSATARARPTPSAVARFVDELIARVRRAGAPGTILIRADSGFWNQQGLRASSTRAGLPVLDRRQAAPRPVRALIEQIPTRATGDRSPTTPTAGEAQIAETELGGRPADRAPHPPLGAAGRAVPRLAPPLLRDQPHRPDRASSTSITATTPPSSW